jgi:subtilisin family serine protease
MSNYYHWYKGRKIEFERESGYEVESRKGTSNKLFNNFKSQLFSSDMSFKSLSKHSIIIFSDSDNIRNYLKSNNSIKKYNKVSTLKYNGVYYKDYNSTGSYEYVVELRDHTLKINEVLTKISVYNQSHVALLSAAGNYIFLVQSSSQELNNPKEYKEFISLEKNIYSIGSFEADEIDLDFAVQNIENKPHCKPFSQIQVTEAHKYVKEHLDKNYTPRIALLDNGIYHKHYELVHSVNEDLSWNYVNNQKNIIPGLEDFHGTACAGIIGARQKSEKGFNGIAFGSEIIGYKICSGKTRDSFFSSNFYLIKAFYDAAYVTKCDVITCSFSLGYESMIFEDLITKITREGRGNLGLPIVFSAGNDKKEIKFPTTINNVFTISSSSLDNEPLRSSYGKNVLVGAPGEYVVTTNLPETYGENNLKLDGIQYYNYTYFDGTSASAPIVAGLVGLILQIKPNLTLDAIRKLIISGCDPLNNNSEYNYGKGVVNVLKTIKNINPKTNKMSNSKFNLTGNVVLSGTANHNQFIYGSQLYGTNFGVFCDFNVGYPDANKKTECNIIGATASIVNYKGILDLGILGMPTLKLQVYNFGDRKETALVMNIKLQAVVAGKSTYSAKVKIDKTDLIKEEHLFVVNRDLVRINNDPKNPIVDGVFENEFYYRDGLRYAERKVTEVPEEYYYNNEENVTYQNYPLQLNIPGAKCANAINRLTIY